MGTTPGQTGLMLLKGGLSGLGQGLQQQQNPNQQFDFSKLQQGFQQVRKKPALNNGIQQPATPSNPFRTNGDIYG